MGVNPDSQLETIPGRVGVPIARDCLGLRVLSQRIPSPTINGTGTVYCCYCRCKRKHRRVHPPSRFYLAHIFVVSFRLGCTRHSEVNVHVVVGFARTEDGPVREPVRDLSTDRRQGRPTAFFFSSF